MKQSWFVLADDLTGAADCAIAFAKNGMVSDVLFAMVKEVEDQRPAVALKASPELAELLRQQHRDVRPSQHLNKAHWSTVFLDGSLPDSQIYYLVDASYQQAVKMLPEPVRQQLSR